MGMEELLPLFGAAGFVDIEVVEKLVDVGDWRGGFLISIIGPTDFNVIRSENCSGMSSCAECIY